MKHCDVGIIGAGVVGCAIARELSRTFPHLDIVLLEKGAKAGSEMSTRNSGVLHSGFHENPRTLKALLARQGSKLAISYAREKNIPILNTGMLIAVSYSALRAGLWKDAKALGHLVRRGRAQGIRFQFLTPWGLQKIEPWVHALFGIFIPEVSVIDTEKFMYALEEDARKQGVRFYYENGVIGIARTAENYLIASSTMEINAPILINAAGIFADEIARMAGVNSYTLHPWRGEYYEIMGEKNKRIKRLVYPALPQNSPSKGIHFSPRPDGRLFLGPNALEVPSKNDYESNKTPVEVFLEAGRKFMPDLCESDLRWAYSGIRAKLNTTAGLSDFLIRIDRKSPMLVNLLGIDSPGLSSGLAMGKLVTRLIETALPRFY